MPSEEHSGSSVFFTHALNMKSYGKSQLSLSPRSIQLRTGNKTHKSQHVQVALDAKSTGCATSGVTVASGKISSVVPNEEMILSPRGHLAMLGDKVMLQLVSRWVLWQMEAWGAAQHPSAQNGSHPPPGMAQPQRVVNSAEEKLCPSLTFSHSAQQLKSQVSMVKEHWTRVFREE